MRTLPLVSRFPIQLGFSIVLLSFYFGISLLGSVAIGFILSFTGFIIAKAKAIVQIKILKEKDKRMRTTTEVVNNIKSIKLNSWTHYFSDKISNIRNNEVNLMKIGFVLSSLSIGVGRLIAPALVITILAIYFANGSDITIAKAFGGIQVLRNLEFPLRWIPDFISSYLEFSVSMKRIQKFLLCSELNSNLTKGNHHMLVNSDIDVLVENANFTWGGQKLKTDNKRNTKCKLQITNFLSIIIANNEELKQSSDSVELTKQIVENSILLKNLSLKIHKGEFVCIIGEVGAGKSSLIHALLGDMIYVDAQTADEFGQTILDDNIRDTLCKRSQLHHDIVKLGGTIGLVQQTPWIQNMTIRDNILFGLPLDEDKYNRVIEV